MGMDKIINSIKYKQYPVLKITIMQLIPYIHLSLSIFSTYCVFTNYYLCTGVYLVGIVLYIDYILHYLKINLLRPDIQIHHLFALFIVHFVYNHREFLNDINSEITDFIKNVLSLEVSTIFLSSNFLLSKTSIIYKINHWGFITSFAYFRIYQYTRYVILSEKIYYIVINISKHLISQYSMFIGIYGLGILNFYWFYLILQKTFHKYACIDSPKANKCNKP
jgi:hypothetical protein